LCRALPVIISRRSQNGPDLDYRYWNSLLCSQKPTRSCELVFGYFRAPPFATAKLAQFYRFSFLERFFSRVPMMGFEPIPRFSQERILSPLRLPFRHIGLFGHFTLVIRLTKTFPHEPFPLTTRRILGRSQPDPAPIILVGSPLFLATEDASRLRRSPLPN
jgi:hypothetical protein